MIPFSKHKRRTFHYRYRLEYKSDNTWIEKSKEGLRKTCQHPSTQERGTGKNTCFSNSDHDPFLITFFNSSIPSEFFTLFHPYCYTSVIQANIIIHQNENNRDLLGFSLAFLMCG